jgi:RNA polymerase-binding transcription factor
MTCHAARRIGEFERRLRRERREAYGALLMTDSELAGCERHHPGDFLDDAATGTTCRVLAGLEKRDRHVLAEIDAAEARLATGTYGVCEMCACAIPFDRLRAIPTARLCVVCEEVMERPEDPRIASKIAAPAA